MATRKHSLILLVVGFFLASLVLSVGAFAEEKKVNINTASQEELTQVGFESDLAARIIEYRQQHGPFASLDDLTKVEGMSSELWEQFKDRLCADTDC